MSLLRSKCWHVLRRQCLSHTSSSRKLEKPPQFITTPIFYVNADPHIGHLYSAVYADAIARFSRAVHRDNEVIFSTGTDEHGLKVQRAAEKLQVAPQQYCDQVSASFRDLFDSANISYSVFNRTTDAKHKKAVQKLWSTLVDRGFIYKATYSGYYSVSDECFVPDNLIVEKNGQKFSSESGHSLEWHEEDNYMFRLSELEGPLREWIDNRLVMRPENFFSVLQADVRNIRNLHNISVSRAKSRLQWGVDVPGDSEQVIYVWFDALINYLTACGYPDETPRLWPAAHLIGKEILKFHAIYWPAFLLAAGMEPPEVIYCHSHWLYEDQKMSKSKGNVVDPKECIDRFGVDGIRYFLLKEGTPHSDSSFSMEKVKITLNADLANTYGNLLNRCTSAKVNARQQFPLFESSSEVVRLLPEADRTLQLAGDLRARCYEAYLNGSFYLGIAAVMELLQEVNAMISLTEPWKLARNPDLAERLDAVLFVTMESLRIAAILLEPITPNISQKVAHKLALEPSLLSWDSAQFVFGRATTSRRLSNDKTVLFSKLQS